MSRATIADVLISRDVCVRDEEQPPPGAVVGVLNPEREEIWTAGRRDTAGAPMEAWTTHDLASVTKLVTTCALMTLVSKKRIKLDSPVSQHIPWSGPDPTLRQLLQHRTGLLPWQPLHHRARRADDTIALVPTLPRVARVDEERVYSDLSFIVLGAVVASVTRSPLDTAIRELVCQPLGLDLHYRPRQAADPKVNIAESALDEGWDERMIETGTPYPVVLGLDPSLPAIVRRPGPIRGTVHDANAYHAMGGVSGHAGLFGTVPELLSLGRALIDTSHGLWSEAVVAEFTTRGPDPMQGLGLRVRPLPRGRLAWHPGFTGTALGVRLGADPLVVAMATNRHLHDGDPVPTDRLWEHVLSGVVEPPRVPGTHQAATA